MPSYSPQWISRDIPCRRGSACDLALASSPEIPSVLVPQLADVADVVHFHLLRRPVDEGREPELSARAQTGMPAKRSTPAVEPRARAYMMPQAFIMHYPELFCSRAVTGL